MKGAGIQACTGGLLVLLIKHMTRNSGPVSIIALPAAILAPTMAPAQDAAVGSSAECATGVAATVRSRLE